MDEPHEGVDMAEACDDIREGATALGIELGSTRIKAVLIDSTNAPIAVGSHEWASTLTDGLWSYSKQQIISGLQAAYAQLKDRVQTLGVDLTTVGAIGISAMMHGYIALDADGELLVPFRTWQNTVTEAQAQELSELFGVHIPQRWSVAHLLRALDEGESHIGRIERLTTLSGYVHLLLTGKHVLGVGDASGMFPIDDATGSYHEAMQSRLTERIVAHDVPWVIDEILPTVLSAGESAGELTADGARLLDPSGQLQPGIPFAPPEGDAGTGMVATNSVGVGTANVSAGTSIFAMVVLEGALPDAPHEIDMVTTPAGDPVAMVHCNNGAVELQSWVGLLGQAAHALGAQFDDATLYETLYRASLQGTADGMVAYNYRAGEHIVGASAGRPLFTRLPDSTLSLANFMRTHLFASFGALRIGFDLLRSQGVKIETLFAHGGLFRTKGVAQRYLAAAVGCPVSVGDEAGEGGAWGMALLAAFTRDGGQDLTRWLSEAVFAEAALITEDPRPEDLDDFTSFMERYRAALPVEMAAISSLH